MGKRLAAFGTQSSRPSKYQAVAANKSHNQSHEQETIIDEGNNETARLCRVRDDLQNVTKMLDEQLDNLNKMIFSKANVLVNLLEVAKAYGRYNINSSTVPEGETKFCNGKLSLLKEFVARHEQVDDYYEETFVGKQFTWKNEEGVSVFSGSSVAHKCSSCRLDCPIMKVGSIYRWTVNIRNKGDGASLGIVFGDFQLDLNMYLGSQQGGWEYDFEGRSFHNQLSTKTHLPKFETDDRVTLTLDLSSTLKGQMAVGTLSATIEGRSKEAILFDNILNDCKEVGLDLSDDDGFYPAVSGKDGTRVEFLGFESSK